MAEDLQIEMDSRMAAFQTFVVEKVSDFRDEVKNIRQKVDKVKGDVEAVKSSVGNLCTSISQDVEAMVNDSVQELTKKVDEAELHMKGSFDDAFNRFRESHPAVSPIHSTPITKELTKTVDEAELHMKKIVDDARNSLLESERTHRVHRMTTQEIKRKKQDRLEQLVLSKCEDGLEVRDSTGKGRGVFATKKFEKGDFVVEYSGELIEMSEAKHREALYSDRLQMASYMYYFEFKNKHLCIDATKETGHLGRLLNHSRRNGNCQAKLISMRDCPVIIILASKEIGIGEEILYDYGDRSRTSIKEHPWLAL